MDMQYYAFALFVAALVCLIAVLFKLLFAGVKRQRKLLDEKESELLRLYRTVESIMEDFNDQIKAAIDEIKEYESRAAAHMAAVTIRQEQEKKAEAPKPPEIEAPAMAMTVDSSRIRAASEVLERAERMIINSAGKDGAAAKNNGNASKNTRGEGIQRLFDDTAGEPQTEEPETASKNKRMGSILALAQEGKTQAQIAQELSITQNEVMLVIGLNGRN